MISRKNENIIHETFVYIKRHFFTNKNNLLRAKIGTPEGNIILFQSSFQSSISLDSKCFILSFRKKSVYDTKILL